MKLPNNLRCLVERNVGSQSWLINNNMATSGKSDAGTVVVVGRRLTILPSFDSVILDAS